MKHQAHKSIISYKERHTPSSEWKYEWEYKWVQGTDINQSALYLQTCVKIKTQQPEEPNVFH